MALQSLEDCGQVPKVRVVVGTRNEDVIDIAEDDGIHRFLKYCWG